MKMKTIGWIVFGVGVAAVALPALNDALSKDAFDGGHSHAAWAYPSPFVIGYFLWRIYANRNASPPSSRPDSADADAPSDDTSEGRHGR
jgi:hypothetical protein